mgnify:CR=1 FL=1
MKLQITRLFPTSIFVFDDVLEDEYIDGMLFDIKLSAELNKEKRTSNWQSHKTPKLYENKKYKELGKTTLNLSKTYMNELLYEYDELSLTDMWSNILKPGETHAPHTHSNNFISGVFYLQSNDDSPAIQFLDPRGQTSVITPQQKEYTMYNSGRYFFPANRNRMILFPSWLQHYVPVNTSNDNRISIAFNVMLKGLIGNPESFQSSEV